MKEFTVIFEKPKGKSTGESVTGTNQPYNQRGCQNTANILTRIPGVNRDARAAMTPLDIWKCLFTDDIMDTEVFTQMRRFTISFPQVDPDMLSNDKSMYLHDTNVVEMSVLIALIYACVDS